jgi:ribonucleoside-diphosphate reductase alpha chain
MDKLIKKKRPKITNGITERLRLTCGNMYITINYNDGEIFEVFATIGKAGGCTTCQLYALTTAVTMGIRYGVPIDVYIKKLAGSRCPSISTEDGVEYLSCVDAIGQVLANKQKELSEQKVNK